MCAAQLFAITIVPVATTTTGKEDGARLEAAKMCGVDKAGDQRLHQCEWTDGWGSLLARRRWVVVVVVFGGV